MANPTQAVPAAPTVSSVQRHIALNPSQRLIPNIKNEILFRTPEASPLLALTKGIRGKKTTGNREFGAFFKDDMPRLSAVADATVANDAVTLNVTAGTGKYFYTNALAMNTTTREVFRVSSVSTDALTIVRLSNPAAMVIGQPIMLLGAAFPEGSAKGNVKSVVETYNYSYCQIHRTGWALSRRQIKGDMYGGRDAVTEKKAQTIRHMQELEYIALFGRRYKTTIASGEELSFTMGAEEATAQNVWDLEGNKPTLNDVNVALELYLAEGEGGWRQNKGGGNKVLFHSPAWATVFDEMYANRIQSEPVGGEGFSFQIKYIETSHGRLNLVKHPLLVGPHADRAFLIDPNHVTYYTYTDSDTMLREGIETPGTDGTENEFLTDFGLLWEFPLAHAMWRGLPTTV